MDEDRSAYVEDFGLLFEGFGLPRMVGRVLGMLLISEELSAEQLAGALRASRGSISSSTRSLIQMGLAQRRSRPGERRDYFRIEPGAWGELMRREIDVLAKFRRMAERGLGIVDGDDPRLRRNLEEMRGFYSWLEREMPALLERWEEEKTKEDLWARS